MMNNGNSWSRGLRVSLIALMVLFLVWGAVAINGAVNASNNDKVNEPSNGSSADAPNCPAEFAQKDITDPKLNRFIGDGIDATTANKSRNKFLAAVGHDASVLKFYATQFGIDNLPSEAKMLTADEACLSKAGRQVHHDLTVVMNASGVEFGDAPDGVYNSGINDKGLPVIDTAPGISGNKKALKVTLPDGSKVIMLVRCGNPVFEQPPANFTPGPTDNPEPECTQNCNPPPPSCEPGECQPPPTCEDTGTCLEPKDPEQEPASQDNAPEGNGENDTNGPGTPNPPPTFSDAPHTNPPPPPASDPPSGSTPAPSDQPSPPPPEPSSNPGDGGGNEGDPGGF